MGGSASPPPRALSSSPLFSSLPLLFLPLPFFTLCFSHSPGSPSSVLGCGDFMPNGARISICALCWAPTVFSIVGWKWVCLTAIGGAAAYGGGLFHTLMFVGSDLDLAVTVVGSLILSLSWRSFSCRYGLVAAVIPIWNFRWLMAIAVGLDGGAARSLDADGVASFLRRPWCCCSSCWFPGGRGGVVGVLMLR